MIQFDQLKRQNENNSPAYDKTAYAGVHYLHTPTRKVYTWNHASKTWTNDLLEGSLRLDVLFGVGPFNEPGPKVSPFDPQSSLNTMATDKVDSKDKEIENEILQKKQLKIDFPDVPFNLLTKNYDGVLTNDNCIHYLHMETKVPYSWNNFNNRWAIRDSWVRLDSIFDDKCCQSKSGPSIKEEISSHIRDSSSPSISDIITITNYILRDTVMTPETRQQLLEYQDSLNGISRGKYSVRSTPNESSGWHTRRMSPDGSTIYQVNNTPDKVSDSQRSDGGTTEIIESFIQE